MEETKNQKIRQHITRAVRALASVPVIHTVECTIDGQCRCWRRHVDEATENLLAAKLAIEKGEWDGEV